MSKSARKGKKDVEPISADEDLGNQPDHVDDDELSPDPDSPALNTSDKHISLDESGQSVLFSSTSGSSKKKHNLVRSNDATLRFHRAQFSALPLRSVSLYIALYHHIINKSIIPCFLTLPAFLLKSWLLEVLESDRATCR